MTFNCLSQNTNIFGKHFLEASAGTGKTFAIEHLYVRLLLEGEKPLSIDQILTVTFTKAAARELKSRIRANIENILSLLKKDSLSEIPAMYDYLKPFFLKKEKALKRLKENLSFFEQAEIYTIHGFCYRMLALYPFESKTVFNFSEKIKQREIIKNIVMDYLRYSSGEISSAQVAILLKHYEFPRLVQKLIAGSQKNIKKYPTIFEYCSQFNSELTLWSGDFSLEQLLLDYDALENFYKKEKKQSKYIYIEEMSLLLHVLKQRKATVLEFNEILKTSLSLFEFISDDNKKKNKKDIVLVCKVFFDFVKNKLYPIVKDASDYKKIFVNLSLDVEEKIKKALDEDDIILPDDILLKMEKALSFDTFKQKAAQKYRAVIIDEFQDTDAVQWRIFQTLFTQNDLAAFYLVGDPKQSIYSFRSADLYTYFHASSHFDKISFLDVNYRSSPKLVEGLNYIFSKEFSGEWLKLPLLKKSLPYFEVKAGKTESYDFKDSYLPLHFFVGLEKKESKYRSLSQLEESLFFPYIANEIVRLVENCQISLKDIAILVKDRYQAKKIKQFLTEYGINAFSRSQFPLAKTPAATSLQEFLQAVINYKDMVFVKIALLGPFVCLTDKELDNNLEKSFLIFGHLNNVLQKKGLSFFFAEFFNAAFSTCTVYEKMIRQDDLSFYYNTMQLIDLLIEEESKKRFSYESLISFFENLSLMDVQDDDRLNVKPPLDANSVQIMTIHMSKGLEFEVVFALGLASRTSEADFQEENEKEAEKLRALYVGLTRAKKREYVPVAILKKQSNEPSCMELFLSEDKCLDEKVFAKLDHLRQKNVATYEIIKPCAVKPLKDNVSDFSFKSSPLFVSQFEKRSIFSFSYLSHQTKEDASEKEVEVSLKTFPAGPEVGILFHRIFEKIFKQKNGEEQIKNIIFAELCLNPIAEPEIIFDIIQKALHAPLFKNGFSLADVKRENIIVESEFFFSEHLDYVKGFIDLVFLHQGKYYLLDWKTNFLGNAPECYEKKSLEKEMEKHDYFLQAAIYSEALMRFLKIIDPRPFEKIFGGVFYFFIRGVETQDKGVYHFIPDMTAIEKEIQKRINYVK